MILLVAAWAQLSPAKQPTRHSQSIVLCATTCMTSNNFGAVTMLTQSRDKLAASVVVQDFGRHLIHQHHLQQ